MVSNVVFHNVTGLCQVSFNFPFRILEEVLSSRLLVNISGCNIEAWEWALQNYWERYICISYLVWACIWFFIFIVHPDFDVFRKAMFLTFGVADMQADHKNNRIVAQVRTSQIVRVEGSPIWKGMLTISDTTLAYMVFYHIVLFLFQYSSFFSHSMFRLTKLI